MGRVARRIGVNANIHLTTRHRSGFVHTMAGLRIVTAPQHAGVA